MTLVYLLRHAESEANKDGILAGRMTGIGLSKKGLKQSLRISKTLASIEFTKVYISPLQRCRETIAPFLQISKKRATEIVEFVEMDYGLWSGRKLKDLQKEKLWKAIQREPSSVTFPKGESFKSASLRIRRGLNRIAKTDKKGPVLVVSHGDPIKLAVQIALNGNIDEFQKIVIDPGSVTIIDWPKGTVLGVNLPVSAISRTSSSIKSLKARKTLGGGTNVSRNI